MDGRAETLETEDAAAAAVVVENEAESKQVREEKSTASGHNYLDTCPVCFLNFHSREPKLLPCLHSFCKKCLPSPSRNLAMKEPPNSQQEDSETKPRESLCLQTMTIFFNLYLTRLVPLRLQEPLFQRETCTVQNVPVK